MPDILPGTAVPLSWPSQFWIVVRGALALFLPWALVTSYTLHVFYLSGAATLLDSGWFVSMYTHGDGLALQNPPIIRQGSYYAFHMSPLIAILRLLHGVIWQGYDAVWFSLTQGLWYGLIGLGTWLAMRKAAPQLALPAALLTALGGVELATLGFPHFEVAMPAILIVFLVMFGGARNPWALLLLPVLLSVREDAGLHAAAVFLLIGLFFASQQGNSAGQATKAYFALAAVSLASVVASLAIQHVGFTNGYEALGHTYVGQPPLNHVNLLFLKRRLANLALYRLYIFLPVAVILLAALRLRNPLLLAGPLACAPWLCLSLLAVSEQAGVLCATTTPSPSCSPWPGQPFAWRCVPRRIGGSPGCKSPQA